MKAFAIDRYKSKDGDRIVDMAQPAVGDNDVLVQVHAVKQITRVLSIGARRKAKRLKVSYRFLFMRANGAQLSEITSLINQGVIRPVMDRVFPFDETKDALDYVEKGRAKGKVVVKAK